MHVYHGIGERLGYRFRITFNTKKIKYILAAFKGRQVEHKLLPFVVRLKSHKLSSNEDFAEL